MKKLYLSEGQKNYSRKRSSRELKKKKRRSIPIEVRRKVRQRFIRYRNLQEHRKEIIFPEYFSISENTDETLIFFRDLQESIVNGKKVYLYSQNINKLTLDALLYVMKIFDYCKISNISSNVKGNVPERKEIKKLFHESGFLSYIDKSFPMPKKNKHILKIMSGTNVDQETAKQVIKFSLKHLSQEQSLKSKNIYRILIEMMNNTVDHAYHSPDLLSQESLFSEALMSWGDLSPLDKSEMEQKISKWYLITWYDKEEDKIKLAFLDGGLGIPTTIKKNYKDKVREILGKMTQSNRSDCKLIFSALSGDFRTRTHQGHRGKGLPTIYKSAKEENVKNLKIFSNYGAVDCTLSRQLTLDKRFDGTLFTWNFN